MGGVFIIRWQGDRGTSLHPPHPRLHFLRLPQRSQRLQQPLHFGQEFLRPAAVEGGGDGGQAGRGFQGREHFPDGGGLSGQGLGPGPLGGRGGVFVARSS